MREFTGGGAGDSPWIVRHRSHVDPAIRLFCLPYAGGNAAVYHGWQEALPADVEVCRIQLPGRGARLGEPLQTRMAPMVRDLAEALRPYLDVPFAIFGHSMGALIAFELARVLCARGLDPAVLFVSAWRSPEIPHGRTDHALPDADLVTVLRRLNGTPPELLDDPEALLLLLPVVRADFEVAETYEYRDEPPLSCRIKALAGVADASATPDLMRPWSRHTKRSFSLSLLPGDHFFLERSRDMLLTIVAHELAAAQVIRPASL